MRTRGRETILLSLLAFFSLGLPDGVLGVAWPSMQNELGLPVWALGPVLAASATGYFLSSFVAGWLLTRLGIANLLVASTALLVVSLAVYGLASHGALLAPCAIMAGLGAGAIDAAINAFAARRLSHRWVTLLHAFYGLGAMIGPVLMTALLQMGRSWRWGYALLALTLGAMMLVFTGARRVWIDGIAKDGVTTGHSPESTPPRHGPATMSQAIRARPVQWQMLLFLLYTGLEVTAGQWAYSLLSEGRGGSVGASGAAASVYWLSLTVGRVLVGAAAARAPVGPLLRVAGLGAALAAIMLAASNGASGSTAGLALLGLCFAPVYPLLIADTPRRVGQRLVAYSIGFQVSAACFGAAAIPWFAGAMVARLGYEMVALTLVAGTTLLAVMQWVPVNESLAHGEAADPAPGRPG
jgi:fucose permease